MPAAGELAIPLDQDSVAEARLVAAALAGSQAAFERIVVRYQRPVLSLLVRLTGDRALAEELAQDTFVKAFRSLSAFDTSRRLSSWLFRIAHNAGIDALRRASAAHSRPASLAGSEALPSDFAAPAEPDPVERRALGDAIQQAFARLRPEQRSAVVLRYEEGLPFEEIARILGIAEATARSHVHRARKQLVRMLSEAGWNPADGPQRAAPALRKPE
jgi:RNA polymerase sigma-70 factor, ECF subfamily